MKSIPVLAYHNVGHAPEAGAFGWLYVTPRQFKWQMRALAWLGYRGVSMEDGLPFLRGERRGRVVILTFDDGYRDNLLEALPVLLRHRFSATCYLVADRLGEHNAWDADAIGVRKPLMSRAEVSQWLAAGMHVGSHTCSHPRLTQLSSDGKRAEIEQSRQRLEASLNIVVEHFCYPYGDFDAVSVEAVRDAGYVSAVTTERGRAQPGSDPLMLRRITVKGRHGLLRFLINLVRRYDDPAAMPLSRLDSPLESTSKSPSKSPLESQLKSAVS